MLKDFWESVRKRLKSTNLQTDRTQKGDLNEPPVIHKQSNDVLKFESRNGFRVRVDRPRTVADSVSGLGLNLENDHKELLDALEAILKKQDEDAQKREEKSWYYGNTGKWVRYAALDARQAVNQSLENALQQCSLDPILLAVARAYANFQDYYGCDDEDGYGSATLGEVLRDILVLQKDLGETSKLDPDQLFNLRLDNH